MEISAKTKQASRQHLNNIGIVLDNVNIYADVAHQRLGLNSKMYNWTSGFAFVFSKIPKQVKIAKVDSIVFIIFSLHFLILCHF